MVNGKELANAYSELNDPIDQEAVSYTHLDNDGKGNSQYHVQHKNIAQHTLDVYKRQFTISSKRSVSPGLLRCILVSGLISTG